MNMKVNLSKLSRHRVRRLLCGAVSIIGNQRYGTNFIKTLIKTATGMLPSWKPRDWVWPVFFILAAQLKYIFIIFDFLCSVNIQLHSASALSRAKCCGIQQSAVAISLLYCSLSGTALGDMISD